MAYVVPKIKELDEWFVSNEVQVTQADLSAPGTQPAPGPAPAVTPPAVTPPAPTAGASDDFTRSQGTLTSPLNFDNSDVTNLVHEGIRAGEIKVFFLDLGVDGAGSSGAAKQPASLSTDNRIVLSNVVRGHKYRITFEPDEITLLNGTKKRLNPIEFTVTKGMRLLLG